MAGVVDDGSAVTVGSFVFTFESSLKGSTTMTAPHIVDPAGVLSEALLDASPDLMRSLLQTMINALLSADADAAPWRPSDRSCRTGCARDSTRWR